MERKIRARSYEGSWGSDARVLALSARAQGSLHVGTAVTAGCDFILDGATFAEDPCTNAEGTGCTLASEVRVLRRALVPLLTAKSLVILTSDEPLAMMMRGWIDGSITEPPAWYEAKSGEGNSFVKVITTLRTRQGFINVRHVPLEDGDHGRLVRLGDTLADTVLAAMIDADKNREWAITRTHELLLEYAGS